MNETNNLTLELPNFEGPLDLLLHLIQSQKIDIYDIPIAKITSQYLAYLQKMQNLNLQIAGEFFVMSSTLLRIKSQYLLPKNDFEEEYDEYEDPRDELVDQLVQYSLFKKVSQFLEKRADETPIMVAKDTSVQDEDTVQPLPEGELSEAELTTAFKMVMHRFKLRKPNMANLNVAEKSITEMFEYLDNKFEKQAEISFFACLEDMNSISDVIGLFLAVLEMCKNKRIHIVQSADFGDLLLERRDTNDN
ncbi:MAG: segregation/condensation protein A [Lactobacillus sp.]|nr:segregation/condensation protein A [Lactobacillus sp.]